MLMGAAVFIDPHVRREWLARDETGPVRGVSGSFLTSSGQVSEKHSPSSGHPGVIESREKMRMSMNHSMHRSQSRRDSAKMT